MSNVYRANRKASDADIIRMNSVGLSLATIARALGCHPTTITLRLKSLGIEPADTRRSFMEDVFLDLKEEEQEWVADQLGPYLSIKEFIRKLIQKEYATQKRALAWREKIQNANIEEKTDEVSEP